MTAGALAEQERALAGLRARAGTVLAAASVAGSFFGAKVNHGSLGTWGVLAMIAFALCVGSAVWVLLPHARDKIEGLSNWLAASCALLAAEIILWTLGLIG